MQTSKKDQCSWSVFLSSISSVASGLDLSRFDHTGIWYCFKREVAICLKFGKAPKNMATGLNNQESLYDSITVTDVRDAENKIVQLTQS